MKPTKITFSAFAASLISATAALAGPYAGENDGVAPDDPRIVGWASEVVELVRGPQEIANPAGDLASFGEPANALGAADALADFTKVVSLGDGGSITVGFAQPIADGAGPDFAVFENSFFADGSFGTPGINAELAFVEVSSNGTDFFRFPSVSLNPSTTQVGAFDGQDATNLSNLAGKNSLDIGTPFDLAELAGVSPELDIAAVTQIRLIDVVGSIDPTFQSLDSLGNPINDPYPTISPGGGFDLDAVAVLRPIPEPTALALLALVVSPLALRLR